MNKIFLYLVMGAMLGLGACRKEAAKPSGASSTLYQLIQADSARFSILYALLQKTHLSDTLQSPGSYTLFAPSDSAFLQAGITMDSIQRIYGNTLISMIKYYISGGPEPTDSFPVGWEKQVLQLGASIDGYMPNRYAWLTKGTVTGKTYVNGVPVLEANKPASNGFMHIIGGIIEHSSRDLMGTITTDPRFRYATAFTITNFFSSSMDTTQKTVFFPDSAAYAAATAPGSNLNPNPAYSSVPQILFAPDFYDLNQQLVQTDETIYPNTPGFQSIQFLLNPGPSVLGLMNQQPANILPQPAVVTTNGVIHFVDQCLIQH